MPPLLCLSPTILDQSFPRDETQLTDVAITLGELADVLMGNFAHLIVTDGLLELINEFDWNPPRPYALLNDIFRLLTQWVLQPHDKLLSCDVSQIRKYQLHPIPENSMKKGLVEIWEDEVGRLLTLHDRYCNNNAFFIGIACEWAFSGKRIQKYDSSCQRAFPLVGIDDIASLDDAYDWGIPGDIHQKHVSVDSAFRNLCIIGAIEITPPSAGSHYKVKFKGERPWVLDPNTDPIPLRFLKELEDITGFPLLVIKTALIGGYLPPKRLKLRKEID